MEKRAEQQKYIVLLTAAVILCLCRYLLPVLPDSEFFLILKTWLQEPKRYRLDFAAVIVLIISTIWIFSKKEEKAGILYWTEFFAFAAALPAFYYLIDLYEWVQAGGLESPQEVWEDIRVFLANVLLVLIVIFVIGITVFCFKNRRKIPKVFYELKRQIQKDTFLAQLIVFLALVHVVRIWCYFEGMNRSLEYAGNAVKDMDSVFMVVFMLAFLMIVVRCIKKKRSITPVAWIAIFLCLLGITPVCEAFREIIEAFAGHPAMIEVILVLFACIYCFCVFLRRLDKTGERNRELVELLKRGIYELSEAFLELLFAPFRLIFSYGNLLFEAVLDDGREKTMEIKTDVSKYNKRRNIAARGKEETPEVKRARISKYRERKNEDEQRI